MADPGLYYANNVVGSLALMEALVTAGVTKIVFSSTCAVYGSAEAVPIAESARKQPLSPYGRSKLMVEDMLADFDRAHGLRSVSLRYFNACGADPEGEVGEWHDPEPHIIPRALMTAAGLIPHFEVLGTDYPTRDGTAVRDYTHVSDLAQAHVAALQHLQAGGCSDAMNLGIGMGYSVREVLETVARVTGQTVETVVGPRRDGDPAEVVADAAKAKRTLRFEPKLPELDNMVETAWRWHSKRGFRRQ